MIKISAKFIALPLLLALAACGGTTSDGRIQAEETAFEQPIKASAGTVESWKLVRVDVTVDPSLRVSTNPSAQFPREEIVWYGEPYGDRRAQVDKIVTDAIGIGASGLRGNRPVVLDVDLKLFHAVTPRAVNNRHYAWHDIQFIIKVRDANTGKVLETSVPINADLEAYRQEAAKAAALKGETQKVRISRRISSVVHAWLQSNGATIGQPRAARTVPPQPPRQQRRTPPKPAPTEMAKPDTAPEPVAEQPIGLPDPTAGPGLPDMPDQPTMPQAPEVPDEPALALNGPETAPPPLPY